MMLSQTGSKGQTKPGITRHNTIGQNFLSPRSADIDASKIFDEVGQDLSIRDFLSGRQPPTYSLAGAGSPSKQARATKPSPTENRTAVEVENVDFYSLLRRLQQSPPGRAYQEIDIRMILQSSLVDKRSLKHWLDYLELSELQGRSVDVLYKFELEQKDYGDLDDDSRISLQIDAGKTLDPPVDWTPPSPSSRDLLLFLKRKTGGMSDKASDITPAKVMFDALQVAAAEISLVQSIASLEKAQETQANSDPSAEIARLKRALELVYKEAESTRAWVVRRRANRRALLAQ